MALDQSADEPVGIHAASWSVDISRDASAAARPLDYADAADVALVAAIEKRDGDALEALYDRYGDIVYSVCLRMVSDVQLAEDLTQEVFLRLWRRPALFDAGRGKFLTWLLSVARNRSIDERRSRGRRFRHESPPSASGEEILAAVPAAEGGDLAVRVDNRIVVGRALATLPKDQRLAIQLAYFGGYTQLEIAKRLDQPLGTVKTRIRLGLQKLRLILIE